MEEQCHVCKHRRGDHFETYDGEYVGCLYMPDDDKANNDWCPCQGYAEPA